ncbi:Cytochrome P450 monooxygenase gsfF [Colletotrichum siamense]|nr:Cytochrome P450 monooxygenase gsfF [Colletotrichum siamense]
MAPGFQTVFPADPYAPQVFRAVTNSREIDKGIAASDVVSPALVTAANPGDSVKAEFTNAALSIGYTRQMTTGALVSVSLVGLLPGAVVAGVFAYVIYQRYFHPLAAYPGPFWASLTDLWQVNEFLSLQQPYNLTELHAKYGEFVRYGPDKLSITAEEVVPLVYQKGGRRLPKTEYYDAFGARIPNVFGMRDVELHSIRRRHMSNSFSLSSVKGMEHYLDDNVKILRDKITHFARDGEAFDLKKLLQYYTIDVLGELAFSRSFGAQVSDESEALVPPVVPHTLLGSTTGSWPAMTQTLKRWLPAIPHSGLRWLFEGRAKCARLAAECVERRLGEVDRDAEKGSMRRTDLLTNLILAKHPDTGERLAKSDLEAEAFGFIEKAAYSVTEVENSLPFLRACVKENFRQTPVFTMPLARRVTAPEGIVVAGRHIKQGTSVAVCNHAFHHNPRVWGDDHDVFDPSRWDQEEIAERARYLMHFGLGSRQCIGKALAQTNIYKLASTLLHEFDFQLADSQEMEDVSKGRFLGKLPEMMSVGVSDLKGPLMVVAKTRT